MSENGKRACKATTKAGSPCPSPPLTDEDFCLAHSPAETRASLGFSGEAGKLGGRPRKPSTLEMYRERFEAEHAEWWNVLAKAREAKRAIVVGTGPKARVEYVDDIPTQLAAFREVMDRVFGKPKQAVDVADVTPNRWDDKSVAEIEAYLQGVDDVRAKERVEE